MFITVRYRLFVTVMIGVGMLLWLLEWALGCFVFLMIGFECVLVYSWELLAGVVIFGAC